MPCSSYSAWPQMYMPRTKTQGFIPKRRIFRETILSHRETYATLLLYGKTQIIILDIRVTWLQGLCLVFSKFLAYIMVVLHKFSAATTTRHQSSEGQKTQVFRREYLVSGELNRIRLAISSGSRPVVVFSGFVRTVRSYEISHHVHWRLKWQKRARGRLSQGSMLRGIRVGCKLPRNL